MTHAHALPGRNTHKVFFILVILAVFFGLAYVALMGKTIWNIVERQNLTQAMKQSSSEVAALESSYMTLSSTLTIDHAYTLGFQDVKSSDTLFIEHPVTAVALR